MERPQNDDHPCTCCGEGFHVIAGVGAGRDFMTCKCSRKKCLLCSRCIGHCKCKERIQQLEADRTTALEAAFHFRHCRDCGEGSSCFEGDNYFEQIQAIEAKTTA